MKNLLTSLQIIFSESLYRNVAIGTSLIIAYLSYWLFYQTTTIPMFLENIKYGDFGEFSLVYGIAYTTTTLLIIVLSGISVASAFWLFNHSKLGAGKSLGVNVGGLTAAMFGMGCPVCGAFLLSAVGIAGGLSIFPLQGLELKFVSMGLLAASVVYTGSKVNTALDCKDCKDITSHQAHGVVKPARSGVFILSLEKVFIPLLIVLFLVNQVLISKVSVATGASTGGGFVGQLFGIKTAAAASIIAPRLNPDGKTTTLVEQPTITELPANPNTGDPLADAKVVMLATGKPFYAPDDVSFDDPINAQKKWGALETSIQLSSDLETRYQSLMSSMVCSYCCGGPTSVTTINRCGCAHAKAIRGFFKFMLQNYGDKYPDDQILGEAHRWYAIWYPKGMLEDYLLATGKGDVLGHQTHGGAGSDGRHGL